MPVGPGWRLWLSLLVAVVLGCVVSVAASVRIAANNTREILDRTRAATELQRQEQRRVACDLVARILAAYEEDPPVSQTGRNVVDAWREEYRVIGCPPRR